MKVEKLVGDPSTKQIHVTEDGVELGAALREAREAAGLTLTQVAAQTECSMGNLCNIELGKTMPSVRTLARLAKVLQIQLRLSFDSKTHKKGRKRG